MHVPVRLISALVHRDERGATAVEYAIMIACIAIVIVVAVRALGLSLADIFGDAQLNGALS